MKNLWDEFFGPNAGYALELYERFQHDPASVDATTRAFFRQHPPPASAPGADPHQAAAAFDLAQSIRVYGHFAAALDPLGSSPPGDRSLSLESHGLSADALRALPASVVGGYAGAHTANAWEAIQYLRQVYSASVGHDYLQVRNAEERAWLREVAESGRFSVAQEPIDALALLRRLTQVEAFEHFLQRSFPAKTRFSIEGLDVMVPLLDVLVGSAAETGIFQVLLGMAHRGRLNILAHLLNKPVEQILAEFKDPLMVGALHDEPHGWTGDVKYHAGARRTIDTDADPLTIELTVQMAPNPSHLEAVNPVVEGMARAAGTRAGRPGPAQFDSCVTLPVIIHGDAAFVGQGVVAETLNLYRLPGYRTGGTIHVIANNQIGFTTLPEEARSSLFASDLAKGFRIPIIHINADDPAAAIMAARIAFAYRERFESDFMIDLIGYRRLGHNEGDETGFTQPVMAQQISQHPSVRRLWAASVVAAGQAPTGLPDQLYQEALAGLQSALESLDPASLQEPLPPEIPPGAARKVHTAVPLERLRQANQALNRLPQGFQMHPRLARVFQRRTAMLDQEDWPGVDWSTAEALALATILEDGVPIRLTGQDSERGTFSQRHAALFDAVSGARHVPLQAFPGARAAFDVFNSPLSEFAALGFEFGFNVQAPGYLVIWEAQYGDFITNAQTVIDEFIVSARDKWGQMPSLVLLLPHGYEGQGPDHSSARLERFLNLAADNNLRVANCTTAANYFHLLRRQATLLPADPLPLVVMTPKSLLRHPLVSSPPLAFSQGGWQAVIDHVFPVGVERPASNAAFRRLVLCSGKVYVDLMASEVQATHPEVAVARLEQVAPFPQAEVSELLSRYPRLDELVWVQEEPLNMGAWDYVRPQLERALEGRTPLRVEARPASASPAEGSTTLHGHVQRQLVERAFGAVHEAAGRSAQ